MNEKKPSAKSKVEAVLFSAGQRMSVDEICKLCRSKREEVIPALQELRHEYDTKQSSLMLVEDGDFWKFTVRDHLISIVRKIVTETELPRSVIETLAVIAFKYPILQSDLIKIRTNKAYDHLAELEKAGYITRQKESRTNLIKLTDKFFKYFDLTEERLRDKFKDFSSISQAIKEKEEDVKKIKEGQRKAAEELRQQDEKIKQEIENLDEADEEFEIPVQTYEAKPEPQDEQRESLGNLEVVKTEPANQEPVPERHHRKRLSKKHKEIKPEQERIAEQVKKAEENFLNEDAGEEKASNDLEPPESAEKNHEGKHRKPEIVEQVEREEIKKEIESKIDRKVEEMTNPKKEEE